VFLSSDDQTIIAQCTPQGKGALALLRLSGINVFDVVHRFAKFASGKFIIDLQSHSIHYGWVIDHENNAIDQVMYLIMHGPKTFTGQNVVEITCHNNQFIIEAIIARAIACGARLAQEGEFSKRAVMNGKIDLIQAEAINELIHAQSQSALKKSLSQLQGSFSHWVINLEKELFKALALSEASFEFIDEEMEFAPQINNLLTHILEKITLIKKNFDQQLLIRQGIRIAIIGSVNAGKSSLFNALLGTNRAIVTPIAGTTRDAIEAGMYHQDTYWTLIDTAGLRQTNDIIEQEGIKRSHEQAQKADIILLVYDASRALTAQEMQAYDQIIKSYDKKIITIYNKSDIASLKNSSGILISTIKNFNIKAVENAIENKISDLFQSIECHYLLNQRHFNLLLCVEEKICIIQEMLKQKPIRYELLSMHLNDAIASLSELSGKEISETGMDTIFKEFCIGK
jgi:tRNA modification GTPase